MISYCMAPFQNTIPTMINASIQCSNQRSKGTQACIDLIVHDRERGGFPTFNCQSFAIQTYRKRLIASLSTISKRILDELLEEAKSRAFPKGKQQSLGLTNHKERGSSSVEKVCTLDWEGTCSSVRIQKSKEESSSFWNKASNTTHEQDELIHHSTLNVGQGLQLTKMDWANGSNVLGAIYEINNDDKDIYRCHQGAFVVWDFAFTEDSTSNQSNPVQPHFVFEFESPLTCVAAHHELQHVFAIGSTSGEVLLVDHTKETENHPLVAISPTTCYCHKESVADIQWYFNHVKQEWLLCSISHDGRVLFWHSNNQFKYPVQGFRLEESNGNRLGGSKLCIQTKSSKYERESFVIGSDVGVVLLVQPSIGVISPRLERKFKRRWTYHAMQLLSCVSDETYQTKIIKQAEERIRFQKQDCVDCATIFELKPNLDALYPSISDNSISLSCIRLSSHNGPVTSIDIKDDTLLSSGMDGVLYMYSLSGLLIQSIKEPSSVIETCKMSPITDACFLHVRKSFLNMLFLFSTHRFHRITKYLSL